MVFSQHNLPLDTKKELLWIFFFFETGVNI